MAKDYYKILGIDKNAGEAEIKKAYRRLALKYHPDRGDGDEQKFKEANEAYQVLSDPQKRAAYDQFGTSEGFAGAGTAGQQGPWGYGPSGVKVDFSGFEGFDIGDMGDIFESFFGGGGRGERSYRSSARRGSDIELALKVTFKDAYFGATTHLSYKRVEICPRCEGKGSEPGSKINKCPVCHGTGQERVVQNTFLGSFAQVRTCSRCGGKGKIPSDPCVKCGGSGITKMSKVLEIKIPAGVDSGSTLEISGGGNFNTNGKNPGNLYVLLEVEKDPRFKREGQTILIEKELNLSQAVLGDTIEIPTLEKPIELKIPAGTQSHQKFRIRGKGFSSLDSRTRGDIFVEVIVRIPEKLSREERELFETLARLEKNQNSSTFENFKRGIGL